MVQHDTQQGDRHPSVPKKMGAAEKGHLEEEHSAGGRCGEGCQSHLSEGHRRMTTGQSRCKEGEKPRGER